MLETIFEWCTNACANLLDGLVNGFLSMLEFDMAIIVNEFPVLVTAYDIFQAVAIGLVIAISAISLTKFFTGQTAEARETPVSILFRALVAAALVYMGGYLVQWVVDIAKLPYDAMLNLDATEGWGVDANLNVQEVSIGLVGILGAFGTNGVVFSAAAVGLLALIMVVLIAFNVIRLIVEVCQRFLMVAVLTYSAPLVFATAASKDTSHILQKWISMFLGQCLLMTLSVWTLKAIISGFAYNATAETNYLFKFLMTLAMCKVAQRLDTYIQQLGINAATTGGNLLGEALGAMAMLGGGRGFTRQKGSTAGVLGGAMKGLWGQGILGAIPRAVDAGKKAYGEGGSVKDAASAFGKAYTKNADPASWFGSSKTAQNRRQNSTEKAQAQQKAAAERAQAYPDMNTGTVVGGNGFVDLDSKAYDQGLHIVTPMEAPDLDRNLGDVDGEVDSPFGDSEGAAAPAAAGSFVTADDDSVVASFISSNYTGSGVAGADVQEVLQNTLNNASPAVGEAALMNPNNDLLPGQNMGKGVYANDAIGSVAMERFIGDAVKERSSPFMGVTAYTSPDYLDDYGNYHPGGRHVHGNYQDGMGNWKNVEAVDETAYQGMISDHQKQFTPYTGPSGAQYYMKKSSGYVSPEEALKKAGVSTQQPTTTSSVAVPGTDRINPTPTGPTQPTNNVISFPGPNGRRTDHLPAANQDGPTSATGSNSVIGATGSDAGKHEIGAGVNADTHVGQETKIAADQVEPGMSPETIPAQPGKIPQPGNITQDKTLDDVTQTARVESGFDAADDQVPSDSVPADNNGAYIGAVQTPARETDTTDFSQGTTATMDGGQVAFDKDLSDAGLELKHVSDGDAGAGSYISGEEGAVAEHLAANYSNAAEGGAAYQDIMANTAQASPAAAEAALMNRNHNLTPGEQGADGTFRNDAVGSAMMESGFGQATVDETGTQTRQGGFTNVKAQTAPDRIDEKTGEVIAGGRFVTGNFSDTDGNSKKLTVTDKAGYDSMSEAQQSNYSAFTGASGEQYYKKITAVPPAHGNATGAADTQGAYRTGAGQTSTTQTAENLKTAPAAEKTTPNPSQPTYGNKGDVPVSASMDGQRVNDPKNIASDSPNMPPSTNNAESVINAPAEVSRIGATPVAQTDTLKAETPKGIGEPSHEQVGHEDTATPKVPEAPQAVHIGAGYNAAPSDETNGQGPAFGERKDTEYSGTPGGESFESGPTIEKKTDAGYSATSVDEPIEQGPVIGQKSDAGYSNTADAKTTAQGPVIEPKNEEPFVSQAPNKETLPVAETSLPMESKGAELKAQQPETHQPEIQQQEEQQPTSPGGTNIQTEGTVSNSLGESLNEPGSRHEVGAVTTEQPTEMAGTGSAESREETREVDRESAHEPARKIGAGASLGTGGGELGGDTQSDSAFSGGGSHGSSKRDERPSEDRHAGGDGAQGDAAGNRPNRYADADNSTGYGHSERKYPEKETPYPEKKAINTSPSEPTQKPLENNQSAVTQTVQTPAPVAPTHVQQPQQQQTVVEQKAAPASGRAAVVQQAVKDSAVAAQVRAESPEEQPVRVQERRDTKAREQTIVSEERSTTMGAKHAANTGDHHRKNEGSKLSGQGAGKNPSHKEKPTGHHEIDLALGDDHGMSAGGSSNKRNKPFGGGTFGRKNKKN